MKNKKAQAQIIEIVLIILLFLAAVVIVWQVIRSIPSEPQVTIYKEGCVNNVDFYHIPQPCEEIPCECVKHTKTPCMAQCLKCPSAIEVYETYEVCSPVKVDEIEIIKGFYIIETNREKGEFTTRFNQSEGFDLCPKGILNSEEDFDSLSLDKYIRLGDIGKNCEYPLKITKTKQDLTTNWLEENCECVSSDKWEEVCFDDGCWEEPIEEFCSKYKCGEFTIEIQ